MKIKLLSVFVLGFLAIGSANALEKESLTTLAAQGDPDAQYELACSYQEAADPRCYKWFLLAAKQGHVQAQHHLSVSYYRDKNYVDAYAWALIEDLSGYDEDKKKLDSELLQPTKSEAFNRAKKLSSEFAASTEIIEALDFHEASIQDVVLYVSTYIKVRDLDLDGFSIRLGDFGNPSMARPVTLSMRELSLRNCLEGVGEASNLSCRFVDRGVVIEALDLSTLKGLDQYLNRLFKSIDLRSDGFVFHFSDRGLKYRVEDSEDSEDSDGSAGLQYASLDTEVVLPFSKELVVRDFNYDIFIQPLTMKSERKGFFVRAVAGGVDKTEKRVLYWDTDASKSSQRVRLAAIGE